ncbi:MAG: hypothetical protein ACRDVE_13455 [Actinocrinis sp.]
MVERPSGPARRPPRTGPVAVIEGFAGRRSVIPFAILLLGLLAVGLVILLLLNTALDRGAFQLQAAQKRQSELTDQKQQLQLHLSGLTAPGALASQASSLGMVPNPRPVFLNPGDGAVLGVPTAAPTTAPASPTASPSASASNSATPNGSTSSKPSTPANASGGPSTSATPSVSASATGARP